MAKHSIDAQKYDKAKLLLKKCKDHSDAHSVTIEEKPLDKLAEEILLGLERFVKSENPKKIEIIYQGNILVRK